MLSLLLGALAAALLGAPADDPSPEAFQSWWRELSETDGVQAYRALWSFVKNPDAAVLFLDKNLGPVKPADVIRIEPLIEDLNSDQFAVRSQATRALEKLGVLAEDDLQRALKKDLPLETQRRIETLLFRPVGLCKDPEHLRAIRAVEVLERIGNDGARALLKHWAQGAPSAGLTRQAKESLDRLAQGPPSRPRLSPTHKETDLDGEPLPAGVVARMGTRRFRANAPGVGYVQFTKDQKQLLVSGSGYAQVLDARTGKELRRLDRNSYRPALSPNEKLLVTLSVDGADSTVTIWEWPSVKKAGQFVYGDKEFTRACVLPDDQTLLAVTVNNRRQACDIRKWDLNLYLWAWQSGKQPILITTPSKHGFECQHFSLDGKILATTAEHEDDVCIWEVATGRLLRRFESSRKGQCLQNPVLSRDGKLLAAANSKGDTITVWDLETEKLRRELSFPGLPVHGHTTLAFSDDGKSLAAIREQIALIWELDTGKLRATAQGHFADIWTLALSPSGDLLATAGGDGTARLWDAWSGKQLHILRLDHDWVRALAFSPDGKSIATSAMDDTVRLWETATGKESAKLPGHGPYGDERQLAFTGAGQLISWGDDGFLRGFGVKSGKALFEHSTLSKTERMAIDDAERKRSLEKGIHVPGTAGPGALSRDGSTLGVAQKDGGIALIDVVSGKEARRFPPRGDPISGVTVLSPNLNYLLIYSVPNARWERVLEVWSVASRRLVHTLVVPRGSPKNSDWNASRDAAAWSPDGKSFVVAAPDGALRIYELATGEVRLTVERPGANIRLSAFAPDGRRLAVGLADATALVMDIAELVLR
ncbi:MAG: WD40 repeat domain-containing protein [Planctomycetes bacterium]|nr:WD40 repeat domain-containing protein [Planctomycetota bacterium]